MIQGQRLCTDEKIELARKVCEIYASNDYTLESCLKAHGVESDNTWSRWTNEIAEIAELYKNAQAIRREALKQDLTYRALHAMQKKISGFFIEETEDFYVYVGKKKVLKESKVRRKYIPPSDTLIQVALYNLDPENWQSKQHIQHTGKNGSDLFKELVIKVVDTREENKSLKPVIDVESESIN